MLNEYSKNDKMINDNFVEKLSKLDFVWAIQKYTKIEDFLVNETNKKLINLSPIENKKAIGFVKKHFKLGRCNHCGRKHLIRK